LSNHKHDGKPYRNPPHVIALSMLRFWVNDAKRHCVAMLLDLLRIPVLIREQHSVGPYGVTIDVTRDRMRTTMVVDGLHIIIARTSGRIIGVGYPLGEDGRLGRSAK
jgi:hypothetical protein